VKWDVGGGVEWGGVEWGGGGVWKGGVPFPLRVGSGEGAVSLPRKFWNFTFEPFLLFAALDAK